MFDEYDRRICRGDTFIMGYRHNIHPISEVNNMFLFTTLRIVHITSGEAIWEIDGKPYTVRQGDMVFLNNMEPRAFRSIRPEVPFEYDIYAFTPDAFGGRSGALRLFYARGSNFSHVLTRELPVMERLTDLIRGVHREVLADEELRCDIIEGLLTALLSYAARESDSREDRGERTDSSYPGIAASIARVIAYIHNNPGEDLHVGTLCRMVNLSEGYFNVMFRKFTGMSAGAYVVRCRVSNVIRLLSTGGINVLDAALASGFTTSSGFYQAFKNVTGTTPLRYMQLTSRP